ncbi:MAG: HugZ family protein [Hyphomicrobiales bacterium]
MTRRDNNIRFSGDDARRLMRAARTATLATLLDDGTPYASLVKPASDYAGRPILLVSRLAWHTRNLEADGRASLLFAAPAEAGDPLEAARVTAIGRLSPGPRAACAERFLASHPDAAGYAGFSDFAYWRMEVERCHAVAGFGRIETFEASDVLLPAAQAEAIERLAPGAAEHMNADHRDALALYATHLLGQPAADWRATTLDADGLELSDGKRSVRLAFDHPVSTGSELRTTLKNLADRARSMRGS